MSSYLELVPRDILEYIAFLVVSTPETLFRPPQELLNLLLTSSTLYYSLCTSSAPHLYARIFRSTFDLGQNGIYSTENRLTDSELTSDFVSRHGLLRRVRRRDFSNKMMFEDLCVAMRIIIESAGVNEAHLRSAGFSDFIFTYARRCLNKQQLACTRTNLDCETSLVLWLLALTWSRDDVSEITPELREHFLSLLRPFVLGVSRFVVKSVSLNVPANHNFQDVRESKLFVRNRLSHSPKADCDMSIPSATSAAIILYFALQEASAIKVTPRLLFGRIIDQRDGREGPTMEDYCRMTNYQTPLFGDDCPAPETAKPKLSNSIRHDPQFFNPKLPGSNAYCYLPDIITGLWEGVYMVSCAHMDKEAPFSPSVPDFICKKSMQCSLALFFYFGTPDSDILVPRSIGDEVSQWTAMPRDFSTELDCLTVSGRKTPYEKFVSSASGKCQVFRNYSQALDCLVIGQTAQDHDRAWGGFNFAGRLKRNGTIVMKREPKNSSDASLGTWIFEGNVRYGSVFAGKWRSNIRRSASGINGLFSLGKTVTPSQDEG
ncbi:hypothetical protein DFJ43DRAFT_1153519 [Lentinula guzmanii]|uniref:F-box domain-containing protein n=1 Tax=Lentinula guzmanii TaxID=2804957 RepID=A0AA38N288_9AGAR|nr:hypothetical protein DFJ43DRAFT_1153519 [Lentinula guzmanii]